MRIAGTELHGNRSTGFGRSPCNLQTRCTELRDCQPRCAGSKATGACVTLRLQSAWAVQKAPAPQDEYSGLGV